MKRKRQPSKATINVLLFPKSIGGLTPLLAVVRYAMSRHTMETPD